MDRVLRNAGLTAGYRWKADPKVPDGEGISCNPNNLRDGVRITTNDGYPEPARGRPNLSIRGEALVARVLFEDSKARGVRVQFGDGAWQEIAAREVVLSAGAIHSPAILMPSGIGPAAALAALDIPLVAALPAVGQHFMDHPILSASLALRPEFTAGRAERATRIAVSPTAAVSAANGT